MQQDYTIPKPQTAEIIVSEETTKAKAKRTSSFKHRNPALLDTVDVETPDGDVRTYTIPATPRTLYWAILKFMYQNTDRQVPVDEFCDGVESVMLDHELFDKWNSFAHKPSVRTVKDGKVVEQEARPWRERLVTNARNLCRVGGKDPSGRRLTEQCQALQYETDAEGNGSFILRTNVNQKDLERPKRGRKPRISVVVGQ